MRIVAMSGESSWYTEANCNGVVDPQYDGYFDFESSVLHEIGHVLGLNHGNCPGMVMHDTLDPETCRRMLGSVDIDAIKYLYCVGCQIASPSAVADCGDDACTPDNPVAKIAGFNFIAGTAVWETLEEEGTASYVVEGCSAPNGIGLADLATEPSGVGVHRVSVNPGTFPFMRLVEVEVSGARFVRGITSSTGYSGAHLSRRLDDVPLPLSMIANRTRPVTSPETEPTIVIYATPDLYGAVWDNVLWAWDHYDGEPSFAVGLVEIPDDPSGDMTPQEWIKADIADRHSTHGTRRFHLVGDWGQEYPSATSAEGPSALSPPAFIYSDQWYADVNADEVPDVVVTRWPANSESEVIIAAANNWLYLSGLDSSEAPHDAVFLVGDLNEQSGSGPLAAWMSEQVQATLPPPVPGTPGGISRVELLKSLRPDLDELNDETASLLNAVRPDLISIISTASGSTGPGTFFAQSVFGVPVENAWNMSMLDPLGYAHLDIKSPDVALGGVTHGKVDLLDFGIFGASYTSPPKSYNACVDYVPDWGSINLNDFSEFSAHWGHAAPGGGSAPEAASIVVSGTVALEFEESHPLLGEHTLRATMSLEGVPAFKAAMFALRNENPKLEFLGWTEAAGYAGETMATETVRDGHREVFVGVLNPDAAAGDATVGTAEFRVVSDQQMALTNDDLALVTADLLSSTDQRSTLSLSSLAVRRSVSSVAYKNELAQNYPNPFNPTTTISFSLARATDANLSIYDVSGALVKSLHSGRAERGIHRIVWDGKSNGGQPVASGVYFYKLTAGSFTDTRKMTILK
jgi:hypothetical protein